MTYRNYWRSD